MEHGFHGKGFGLNEHHCIDLVTSALTGFRDSRARLYTVLNAHGEEDWTSVICILEEKILKVFEYTLPNRIDHYTVDNVSCAMNGDTIVELKVPSKPDIGLGLNRGLCFIDPDLAPLYSVDFIIALDDLLAVQAVTIFSTLEENGHSMDFILRDAIALIATKPLWLIKDMDIDSICPMDHNEIYIRPSRSSQSDDSPFNDEMFRVYMGTVKKVAIALYWQLGVVYETVYAEAVMRTNDDFNQYAYVRVENVNFSEIHDRVDATLAVYLRSHPGRDPFVER